MFKGSIVALITPFKDSNLDEEAFISIIHYHLKNGTNGLVPGGTTGESPTITHDEHKKIILISVKESNGKIPVIAGTGSNSTDEAISLTKFAEKAGADAALVVTPYYNKPTQEGLYHHYKAINDNCGIPIIIYNIPPRSVVDMSVDTMARLFELKNIIGVKDATANLDRVTQQKNKMGDKFVQLSGEDGTALEFNLRGGNGCISVTANIAPKLCSEFQEASLAKNNNNFISKAKQINEKLLPLHNSLFIESNPSPVKYGASLLGLCSEEVRLPLVKTTAPTKKIVKSAMSKAGLL
jgi:4-hydroxy-tetrahydrodipicolinate synthase